MSETHDISEADTHTMPNFPANTPDAPLDFGPLFEDDGDDGGFTQIPMPTRSTRKRGLILLSAILLVVLLVGIIFTIRLLRRAPAVTYTQAAATVGNLTVAASGTGPVQPAAVYNLNFPTSAPVATINVQVGQQVLQGDVLATLDPTALQDQINQAQNSVNAAQNSVNVAVSSLNSVKAQEGTTLNIALLTEQKAISACTSGSSNPSGTPTPTPTPDPNCVKLAQDQYTQAQN
ncbi:MAG: biotin/lipoyl-binding protein, partial [Ktedonobacteraceae bacterium]